MARAGRSSRPPSDVVSTRLPDLQLDGLGSGPFPDGAAAPEARMRVVIHNVVVSANFGCTVDLERVAWACYGEYNPRTFRAVKLRLDSNPRSTALIFGSGKVVCTGSGSECAALTAVNVYLAMVQQVHPEARLRSARVENIVATSSLGHPVRLDALARSMMLRSAFDPELFPGLRLKLRHPRTKALVFCGGKVVIAGCRNRADIARAWAAVNMIVEPFLWKDGTTEGAAPTHASVAAARVTNKKNKL